MYYQETKYLIRGVDNELLTAIKILIIFRFFRFFKIMLYINQLLLAFKALLNLIPYLLDLILALLMIFYFFNAIGISLFGGYVTL